MLMSVSMQAARKKNSIRDETLSRHVVMHGDIKLHDFQAGLLPGAPSGGGTVLERKQGIVN